MITKNTSTDIALCYREIEVAEKLLEEIAESISRRKLPDLRDAFGRPQGGLQLGVPSGDNSQRLFYVPWNLAKPVLEAHIAAKRSELSALMAKAQFELGGGEGE